MPHFHDDLADFFGFHQLATLLVNNPALVVGHVVVVQQMFAHIKVVRFDFPLCVFNGAVQHTGLDGFIFLHTETLHHR